MTHTVQTPLFITGPSALVDRSLIVKSPNVAVLFKNGVPVKVLAPGVHRAMFAQLPVFGELDYLLFDAAPFGFSLQVDGIPLRDDHVVSVQLSAWVEPAWLAAPDIIFGYAEKFGLEAHRYLETVEVELYDALRREVLRACHGLSHDDVLKLDLGLFIDPARASIPLARVTRVVSAVPIADPHAIALVRIRQENERHLAELSGRVAGQRLSDDYDFELVQRRDLYDDEVTHRRAIAKAKIDAEVGQLLGVDAWSAAYPEAANQLRLQHAQTLAALLTEYRDMLSPDDIRRATAALGGPGAGGATPAATPQLSRSPADVARQVRDALAQNSAILRSGVGVERAGDRLIVCIAAASLPGAAIVSSPSELARETGATELNAVPVTTFDAPESTAVEVLAAAFDQRGMPEAELRRRGAAGGASATVTIVLVGSAADPELVSARLRAWSEALRELVAPQAITIDVVVE